MQLFTIAYTSEMSLAFCQQAQITFPEVMLMCGGWQKCVINFAGSFFGGGVVICRKFCCIVSLYVKLRTIYCK